MTLRRITSIKQDLNGDQVNVTVLAKHPPTQAVNNDRSLIYWEMGNAFKLQPIVIIPKISNSGDNSLGNFRDKG